MKVAITGARGFVASHLTSTFKDFVVINRNDSKDDILKKLEGVDAVFNLAGAPIIKKWNPEYKKVLFSSRIDTTKKLVSAINESDVKHFISTSAVGAYPDNNPYDEDFKDYSNDYLGHITKEWETQANKCNKPTAIVRYGVILGNDGGALSSMLTPFKLGVGGIIGDGQMMMSWIDVDDLVRVYEFILEKKLTGLYNASSPSPVNNYTFTKALGKVLHRPTVFPLPEFVLKMIFGEGSIVLTGSKEAYPKALTKEGFEFKYKDIDSSLAHLFNN